MFLGSKNHSNELTATMGTQAGFPMRWPEFVERFFVVCDFLSSAGESALSVECLQVGVGGAGGFSPFISQAIAMLVMPFLAAILCSAALACVACQSRRYKNRMEAVAAARRGWRAGGGGGGMNDKGRPNKPRGSYSAGRGGAHQQSNNNKDEDEVIIELNNNSANKSSTLVVSPAAGTNPAARATRLGGRRRGLFKMRSAVPLLRHKQLTNFVSPSNLI